MSVGREAVLIRELDVSEVRDIEMHPRERAESVDGRVNLGAYASGERSVRDELPIVDRRPTVRRRPRWERRESGPVDEEGRDLDSVSRPREP